jgi:putative DNA primase/helicase
MTKKPVNPNNLYGANSTDPSTWGTFEQAVSVIGRKCIVGNDDGTVEGIGFVFSPPYCGIDIDHCIDSETGEINSKALDIVAEMNSYTERSPSGTGIHIIYKGEVHSEWKKKQGNALGENTDIEMYQTGRYFTVTGDVFDKYNSVADRENEAENIQNTYFTKKPVSKIQKTSFKPLSLSDDEILNAARNSRNGMLFSELYAGNWQSKYESQSEADMAFCSMLAFWFQKDAEKMDAIFRRSGLMRDKWNREQSGSTYGAITLQRAIDVCTNVYTPKAPDDKDFFITVKSSEPKQKHYTFDDTGNAQRFIDMFGDKIRFNYNDNRWMIYDKIKWSYDIIGYIWDLIDKAMESMKSEERYYENYDAENGTEILKEFRKHMKKSRNKNTKNALEKEAQHYVPITPNSLDHNRRKLNTPTGIIDLENFAVTPNDPLEYFTKSTAVGIKEGAKCPLWIEFLNDIFDGDKDLISYIQKAVGYSLSGLTDEQCAFFCYGTGNNGKSTFLDVIRCILGDYASNIQPETLMVRNTNSSANSDIARLKGARFVTSVEPNEGLRLNEGLLKQLTGDDMVTARKLYAEEFEFKPEFKLWMATNHKPVIRGTDTGIWRRIHLIPFTVNIPAEKVDRKLKDKLMQELDGIFLWCLEGFKKYNSEGLSKPSAVVKAVEQYRGEMDTISKFLDECTVSAPCRCVKAKDLYNVYSRWCEENGEYKLTNTKFGSEVQKRYERKRVTTGYVYCELDFNDEYNPYSISIKE